MIRDLLWLTCAIVLTLAAIASADGKDTAFLEAIAESIEDGRRQLQPGLGLGPQLNSTIIPYTQQIAYAYMVTALPDANALPLLQKRLRELMPAIGQSRGGEKLANHWIEVVLEASSASCPQQLPAIRTMTRIAQLAWEACLHPLELKLVIFKASASDFDELISVLEIISDTEKAGFFLSFPMASKEELENGPTNDEYKAMSKQKIHHHLVFALPIAVLVLIVTIVSGCVVCSNMGPSLSARVPQLGMPALFTASLFTASPIAPVAAAGVWMHSRRSQTSEAQDQSNSSGDADPLAPGVE